jgi:hypothetical protein
MSEHKFDYITSNIDLIRPSLPGIFFLIQGEEVIYIGESKDIKRDILRHKKKSKEFDKVGIQLFEGSQAQRKKHTQQLTQTLKNVRNAVRSTKKQIGAKRRILNPKRKAKSIKEVSLPQSRLEMIRPPKQSPFEKPATDKPVPTASSQLNSADNKSPISAETKEALIDWTQKVTQEAMAEMKIEPSPPPPTNSAKPDFPDWLQTLDEQPTDSPRPAGMGSTLDPTVNLENELPTWAQPDSKAPPETPPKTVAPQDQADETDQPEWMKDIENKKSNSNSVPPFG